MSADDGGKELLLRVIVRLDLIHADPVDDRAVGLVLYLDIVLCHLTFIDEIEIDKAAQESVVSVVRLAMESQQAALSQRALKLNALTHGFGPGDVVHIPNAGRMGQGLLALLHG